jgi:hypothetical protein
MVFYRTRMVLCAIATNDDHFPISHFHISRSSLIYLTHTTIYDWV